ncbi:MAG: ATP-binding cassette domain-containing protein [bacterium]
MVELTNNMPDWPRLEMCGVRKRFGATQALDGVNFSARAGAVHALVGENGAGKSTLMKILSGAIAPDSGTIRLDGSPFNPRSPHDARRAGVAMIYQELSLAPHLGVQDNVMLGIEPSRFGILRGRDIRERTVAALRQLGHGDIPPDAVVGRLSPAAQQIVEIARSLVLGCRVLVLDEPTSSLAREDVRRLFDVIRGLRERNYSVIYISHFIEEVSQIADSFTILRDGKPWAAEPRQQRLRVRSYG